MFEYAVALIGCASAIYAIPVLLATFLDDQWRMWGSMIAFGALWWLSNHTPLPASVNIFRAMGEGSPCRAHDAMDRDGLLAGVGRDPVFRGAKIVQRQEY